MQSLRDILPVALTPPHAHGAALIIYQTVSYPVERRLFGHAFQESVPGYDRSPPGALSTPAHFATGSS